ncbi:MFS transporter [Dictyobacter arantiisoli]|uniref:MFS transporter n=1 Tax=Dictyobacter arantiisoli TaxID=2014874 RepID=A0A5A5TFR6_9CHLR|nr:MFS transporter [Dictyobacter arantiisoli]GCF10055.1 MFS transporter [Dictyobacter arantiisoli]
MDESGEIQVADSSAKNTRINMDFWKYWTGQTISNLGGSITTFALPLLVYNLTHSSVNLGIATAAESLPYLLFGLLLGAWTDRSNRKRLMVLADLARAAVIVIIPLFALLGWLSVWWIYLVGFVHSTLTICFETGQFTAIPSLVDQQNLVTANGRIQASYSSAEVLGPLLAGILLTTLPITWLFTFDALSFLLSAASLLLIRRSFNAPGKTHSMHIGQDIIEGLRYVINQPVLLSISLMTAIINLATVASVSQLVLFAKVHLHTNDFQVTLFYTASSLGVVVLALTAGPLRKLWSFSTVALGSLLLKGLLIFTLAFLPWYWLALVVWGCTQGLGILFNINTSSLRQAIVPNHMLGRVRSIASVLAWSAIPLGSVMSGFVVDWTHNVVLLFAVSGGLMALIAFLFFYTPLGRAERYLPESQARAETETGSV